MRGIGRRTGRWAFLAAALLVATVPLQAAELRRVSLGPGVFILDDALRIVSEAADLAVTADPDLAQRRVLVALHDAPISDALAALETASGARWSERAGALHLTPPATAEPDDLLVALRRLQREYPEWARDFAAMTSWQQQLVLADFGRQFAESLTPAQRLDIWEPAGLSWDELLPEQRRTLLHLVARSTLRHSPALLGLRDLTADPEAIRVQLTDNQAFYWLHFHVAGRVFEVQLWGEQ